VFVVFVAFDTFIPFLYLVVDYLITWCHRSMDTRVDWPLSLITLVTPLIPSVAAKKYSSPFPLYISE